MLHMHVINWSVGVWARVGGGGGVGVSVFEGRCVYVLVFQNKGYICLE